MARKTKHHVRYGYGWSKCYTDIQMNYIVCIPSNYSHFVAVQRFMMHMDENYTNECEYHCGLAGAGWTVLLPISNRQNNNNNKKGQASKQAGHAAKL